MSKKIKHILLLSVFWAIATISSAQEFSYKHYDIFDGLLQNQVTSLYQDQYNFLWVGTKVGLSRFDGLGFKNFSPNDGIPPGRNKGFFEINSKLFCYSTMGVSMLLDGVFKVILTFPEPKLEYAYVNNNESEVWFAYKDMILIYDYNGLYKKTILTKTNYINRVTQHFKTKQIIYSSGSGTYTLNNLNEHRNLLDFYCYEMLPIGNKIYFTSIYNPLNKSKTQTAVNVYDGNKCKQVYDAANYTLLTPFCLIDKNKMLYFPNASSWVIIDTNGVVLENDVLPEILVTSCLQDREGNIWFGTETGLFRLQSFAFRNYTEKSGMPKYIWSIIEDKDSSICFASFAGELATLNRNKITRIHGHENLYKAPYSFYMSGICTRQGQWLIPTGNAFVLSRENGVFSKLSIFDGPNGYTMSAYEDTINNLAYFGTSSGVYIYNLVNKSARNINVNNNLHPVLCIEPDKYGRLWFCTREKVSLFENDSISNFKKDEISFNKGVVSCTKDNLGNMWVCARDGLYFYWYQNFIKIFDGSYFFIKLYKNTHIIAGTVKGFMYIDLQKFYQGSPQYYKFYDRYNGFIGVECGQNGTCIDSHGEVWIPTSASVVKFMPSRLKTNTLPPSLHLYSVDISDKDLKWESIQNEYSDLSNPVELTYDKHNIKFSYVGISLTCPEKVLYKTRLVGYDSTWSNATEERTVVYTNLPPHKYTFEIKACNEDGVWSIAPLKVSFIIHPAFWQTWWFIISIIVLFALIVASSVYFFMRARRNKELKQRAVEKELISMQIKTINAQIDPHFVFNAIAAIGNEVQENNAEKAYAYFVKVSNLLRSSLKSNDKMIRPLREEIDFVNNYLVLQKLRFGDRFEYTVNVSKDINLDFELPKMCIQTFVENALKHGLENKKSGGLLNVTITTSDQYLFAEITDNGIGRSQAVKYNLKSTGVGLKTLQQFFEIFNHYNSEKASFTIEDLSDPQGEPSGTKIILKIPLNYKFIV